MVKTGEEFERTLTYLGHDHVSVSDKKGNVRLVLACKVMFEISPGEYRELVEQGFVNVADNVRLVLPNVVEGGRSDSE